MATTSSSSNSNAEIRGVSRPPRPSTHHQLLDEEIALDRARLVEPVDVGVEVPTGQDHSRWGSRARSDASMARCAGGSWSSRATTSSGVVLIRPMSLGPVEPSPQRDALGVELDVTSSHLDPHLSVASCDVSGTDHATATNLERSGHAAPAGVDARVSARPMFARWERLDTFRAGAPGCGGAGRPSTTRTGRPPLPSRRCASARSPRCLSATGAQGVSGRRRACQRPSRRP